MFKMFRHGINISVVSVVLNVKDGRTSLHVACRSGQEQIVDMLLEAKADANAITKVCKTFFLSLRILQRKLSVS